MKTVTRHQALGNSTKVKVFGFVLCAMFFTLRFPAEAQQPGKVYRIGTLENSSSAGRTHVWEAFRQGLRELGYVEGKNVALEQRWAEGKRDRLPALAAELVRLKVDAIVTAATSPALAVKKATSTIPIVLASQSDPVGTGLVVSLARPGGNVTGLSSMNLELGGKRLELLKQAFPKVSRVVFLQSNQSPSPQFKELEAAARALEGAAPSRRNGRSSRFRTRISDYG